MQKPIFSSNRTISLNDRFIENKNRSLITDAEMELEDITEDIQTSIQDKTECVQTSIKEETETEVLERDIEELPPHFKKAVLKLIRKELLNMLEKTMKYRN